MWSLAALITAIAISNAQLGESTHKKTLKVAAMQNVCHLSLEMTKVPAYVANRLQQLGQKADKLQELRQILLTAVLPTDGSVTNELSTLVLLTDKLAVDTTRQISDAVEKAILTAGRCTFYAGRVHEFVSVFFQSTTSGSNYCIKGRSHEAQASELDCITDASGASPPLLKSSSSEKPDVAGKYAILKEAGAELVADSTEKDCGLTNHDATDGGYMVTGAATRPIHWGGGLFQTASAAAAAAASWQTNTAATADSSTYQECSKHLAAIVDQLESAQ
uniref:Variant surface glycoprotein 1838 n=1 Tax=Trypanosoma brucei TaxID=5691 RepID=M4T162_9TRYP|nr:variant surface glycoprotein 1838 [Trypanosoma brucei]